MDFSWTEITFSEISSPSGISCKKGWEMKRLLFFIVCLCCQMAMARSFYLSMGEYFGLEEFFSAFYLNNFQIPSEYDRNLLDNAYYASSVFFFYDNVNSEEMLGEELKNEDQIKEAIIKNLLTTFAYAQPTREQQEQMARYIYEGVKDSFQIYSIDPSMLSFGMEIGIVDSCAVGSPEKYLVLKGKNQRYFDDRNPLLYIIRSDACD